MTHDEASENPVSRIMDAVRAAANQPLPPSPTPNEAVLESTSYSGVLENEIRTVQLLAELGQPTAARRVAELLELDNRPAEARSWWHRAAEMEDPDAIYYVEHILHDQ